MDETNSRFILLQRVFSFKDGWRDAMSKLKAFPFDSEDALIITKDDFLKTLHLMLEKDPREVEEWANFLECREDIDFVQDNLQEVIILLANPLLYDFTFSTKEIKKIINRILST